MIKRGISVVGISACRLQIAEPRWYLFVLLVSCWWLVSQARGQSPQTPFPRSPAVPTQVDVPRQLTLEQAEQLLLQNNLAVIAARYGVDNARAQLLIAAVRPNPTLTLGAEAFDLAAPGKFLFYNSTSAANRVYTVRIDQVLERGNKRGLRTQAAALQVQAAEAQVLDTIRTQILQLRQAFLMAVLARENVRVASENLDLTNDTERLIKARVTAGDAPGWDLIKFQANKVQFQRDLASARLAYQQAVRDVLTFIGAASPAARGSTAEVSALQTPALLADAPIEVVGELRLESLSVPEALEELRQVALDHRPDVLARSTMWMRHD